MKEEFIEKCMQQPTCNGCPFYIFCFPVEVESGKVQKHKSSDRWNKVSVETRDEEIYNTKGNGRKKRDN
jgi:hypothetical protein